MTFPTVQGRDGVTSAAADDITFTVPIAAGWDVNLAGDRIYCFVSADGNPTLSTVSSGWSLVDQRATTTQVAGALFMYEVAADNAAIPDLVVSSSTTQQYSARMFWLRSSTGALAHLEVSTGGSSSVTPDPAAVTNGTGTDRDCLVIISYNGDGDNATTNPSGAPAGYSNFTTQAASGSAGVVTCTAEANVTIPNISSTDPGAFTFSAGFNQWQAFTLAVYEAAVGGKIKAWDGGAWNPKPVKYWDGANWVVKPVKFWDGAAWQLA